MNEEARALVKKLLEEGKRYDDVRRTLISEGHGTAGFEDEYPDIQKELGIKEPPPTKVSPHVLNTVLQEDARTHATKTEKKRRGGGSKYTLALLVLAIAAVVFSGLGSAILDRFQGMSFLGLENISSPRDVTAETKLRNMQTSAQVYHRQLLDYQGLCESVGLDQTTQNCVENGESYAVESQLSDGTFYCVDSTEFAGVTTRSHGGEPQCPQ